ncbi:MAG: GGDEF domain-containing protein [Candidatus Lindowbacteria bacterium]|nr:GGDEF domain-containing protein [Candidatus Lindowbacteria bacterium]
MDDRDTVRIDPGSSEYSPTKKIALLQIIRGEDIGREFEVTPGANIIGRQPGCHIQINNKSVSRRHAQIVCNPDEPEDSRYVVYDLNSTNGTRVNNESVARRPIRDGDRIQLGRIVCKFMEVDAVEKAFMNDLKRLIEYDKQTDLLQLKPFYRRLQMELETAEGQRRPVSVLMMDLDGLKQMNDAHGHLTGTEFIQKVAAVINEQVLPAGAAAIYGGDEFAAYLPGMLKDTALVKAEHIRKLVGEISFADRGISERVTISIGVAEYPDDASDMMALMENADRALYVAKSVGRNRVVGYDPSMGEKATK